MLPIRAYLGEMLSSHLNEGIFHSRARDGWALNR